MSITPAERRESDWLNLVSILEADIARLREERNSAHDYAKMVLYNREAEMASLRREIAGLRGTVELQTKATLAFRRDFMDWKARAIRLERLLVERGIAL